MTKPLYDDLNRTWKSTTLAYFGKEFGELPDETYQRIRSLIIQHIVDEIMNKGKDESAASEAVGETTAVVSTEGKTDAINESVEAKA